MQPPILEPWQLCATELADAFARGRLDPRDALESVLDRQARVHGAINALVAIDASGARAAAQASARRWAEGRPLSPLDGVPVSVKDNIPVAGLPCTWGSRLFERQRPARDESPVARLRGRGAVLFAKSNVPEFTLQGYCDNPLFGTTRNPWDERLTPGGSSGGAVAAVAAGVGPLALGTDGGGSIRRPAAYAGLVGLKPGHGTVPRADGLFELLPELEEIGPIARSVADAARLLAAIAPGFDAQAALDAPAPGGLRIRFLPRLGDRPIDATIAGRADRVASRLSAMGHVVSETAGSPLVAAIERFNTQAWPVLAATGLAALMRGHAGEEHRLTPAMQALLTQGRAFDAVAHFEAQAIRRALKQALRRTFLDADLILTPACAAMPWAAGDSHPATIDGRAVDARGHAVFTGFVNGAGLPAIALPAEPSAQGLPIGFQLVAPAGGEARLLQLARDWEAAHPWAQRRPPIGPVRPAPQTSIPAEGSP